MRWKNTAMVNGGWYFIAAIIEVNAKTSQFILCNRADATVWIAPKRTFTGTLNPSCSADIVIGMHANQYYYAGGFDDWFIEANSQLTIEDLERHFKQSLLANGGDTSGAIDAITESGVVTLLKDNNKSIVWRCVSRLEEKGSECTAPTINEETLQTAVVKAINELLANKEPFLSTLQKNIATVFNEENDNATDDIDGKLEELQQQLLIQAKSKNDYEDVADEIYRLRELKQNALAENAEREGKRQRIAEMTDFLNEQSCELEEYDEQLVRRLIEKVTVFDDKLTVEFKSGVEIDIEI